MLLGFINILPLFEPSHVCDTKDFVYQALTVTSFRPFFWFILSFLHSFIASNYVLFNVCYIEFSKG